MPSCEIRCEHCRKWFRPLIQFGSKEAFFTSTFVGNISTCRHCSNLDFHFGHPGRHRYTPSARPRGPDVFVAPASGSRHRQRGAHGGHTRLNRPGSGAFLAHLSLPVLVLREPYAVTLAARQPAGTGSAQIRCSIAPNRRRVR